jgi:hypothetical protein
MDHFLLSQLYVCILLCSYFGLRTAICNKYTQKVTLYVVQIRSFAFPFSAFFTFDVKQTNCFSSDRFSPSRSIKELSSSKTLSCETNEQ